MVSVFEGQLQRTWWFENEGKKHTIILYHDTITGLRSAMFDFEEITGSLGNSSVLMYESSHRIYFTSDDKTGYIEIKKAGWTGFSYECFVDGNKLSESTQMVASHQNEEVFKVKILETTFIEDAGDQVAWYVVEGTRLKDNISTVVHR